MPWSNHEGPDRSLVISERILRETGQFHCLGFFKTMGLMETCLDSGCTAVL